MSHKVRVIYTCLYKPCRYYCEDVEIEVEGTGHLVPVLERVCGGCGNMASKAFPRGPLKAV